MPPMADDISQRARPPVQPETAEAELASFIDYDASAACLLPDGSNRPRQPFLAESSPDGHCPPSTITTGNRWTSP